MKYLYLLVIFLSSCTITDIHGHIDKQEETYNNRKKQQSLKKKGYPIKSRKQEPLYRDKNSI